MGLNFANTRAIVSCEGIPWGNGIHCFRKSILLCPYRSIAIIVSAPQITHTNKASKYWKADGDGFEPDEGL